MSAPEDIVEFLREARLIPEAAKPQIQVLAGGVSSDVFRIDLDGRRLCVKRALPQLRVAAEWKAPTQRSHSEVTYFETVAGAEPSAVPRVLAESRERHLFVMPFFEPNEFPLWKTELMQGIVDLSFSWSVGATLSRIHAAFARSPQTQERFQTDDLFRALRVEPYLLYTAARHSDVAPVLRRLAQSLLETKVSLVHGDVSPKNILKGRQGPIFLDAECAWYGDPAFDLSFCLTHLLLKSVKFAERADAYLSAFAQLKEAYFSVANWESSIELDERAARLLAAILLARVDGKSPVEYLTAEADKEFVRESAKRLLTGHRIGLDELGNEWRRRLKAR